MHLMLRQLMNKRTKRVILCSLTIIFAGVLGLGSRHYPEYLSPFLAEYMGDTMWSLAVFMIFRLSFHRLSVFSIACITFLFSILIEVSQLYDTTWINSIRHTFIGGLLLGFGFLWTDFICYFVGVLIAVAADLLIRRRLYRI